jgi:lipoate---protein ligase
MWIDNQILALHKNQTAIKMFVPNDPLVVLGSSNNEELEVNLENCKRLGIDVTRRYGGGGTVVLYPGCVVVSVGTWVSEPYKNDIYFRSINQAVINALAIEWPLLKNLSQSGISDIVFDQKKIAGTSLFRSRNYLLYQASVIIDLDLSLVENCLRHPSKEPDYRKGRKHADFLTSLNQILGHKTTPTIILDVLNNNFHSSFHELLSNHLIPPVDVQMAALQQRIRI